MVAHAAEPVYYRLDETYQQAFISAEHGVGKGWARAVVTGHKTSVQMP